MADILFDIGVTGVKDLREAADSMARLGTVSSKLTAAYSPLGTQTVKVVKEQNRLKGVSRQLTKAYNDNRITLEQYNEAINQEINNSLQKIRTDEKLIDVAKRKQQAIDKENNRIAKLTATYRKDIVAKKAYLQAQRDIRYAERKGIITQQQMQTELERTKLEFQQFTKGLATGANQFARYNTAVYNSMQRKKRFGQVGLQQVGYQVGDFVVQIQSGTDALVAFGQQGSQLAGIFGARGAIIGALIAGATALGMIYKNIVGASKTSAEDIKAAFSTIPSYFEELGLSIFDSFDRSFSKIEERYGKLIANIAKAQLTQLQDAAKSIEGPVATAAAPSRLKQFFGAFAPGVVGVGTSLQGEAQANLAKQTEELYAQSVAVNKVLDNYKEQVDQVKSQSELLELVKTTHQNILGISKDAAKAFESQAEELGIADAITEEINKKNEKRLEDNKKLQRAATDAMILEAEVMEELRLEEQKRADLYLSKRRYVIDLITKAEQEAAEKVRRLESFRTGQSNKEKRNAIATIYEAERVAAIKNEDLQEFILTGRNMARMQMLRTITAAEQVEAVKQDKIQQQLDDKRQSQENKRFETNSRLRREAIASIYEAERTEILRNASLERFIIVSRNQARVQMLRIISQAEKEFAESEDKRKASLTDIQDTIDALRNQVKQEKELLGLTGERLEQAEIFYKLLEANNKAETKTSEKRLRQIAKEIAEQKKANDVLRKAIDLAVDVGDAFSDFLQRGMKDFKDFVLSIKDMFVKLLADMAAQALVSRILIPIAVGTVAGFASGTAVGATAGAAMGNFEAGTIGASLAAGMSNFGSAALHTITGGASGTVAAGSTMATIGAAAPVILAAVAVIGLLTKKTKLLDAGLRATVEGFDVAIDTFQVTQSSRLFGLLRGSKKTTFTAADADVADPIISSINEMQQSIVDAAGTLGIGADAFDNFVYQFELSLKGLTEQEQLQKVNEEILKMGDNFAALSGHFSNMNDLLATAQQRYNLETRLLQAQGNTSALLTREREAERLATHDLNQDVLDQIYAIEDAKAAFNALSASIQASKDSATADFNTLMDHIGRKISDAEALASQSQSILSMLQGASGRIGMTREAGLDYLRSLRGASRITDEKALGEALSAIGEPSEELYGSFVDYQREFADQSNLIRDLEEKAGVQLSNDEKLLQQLQEEAKLEEERYQSQIDYLDQQLQDAQDQLNALLGLNDSVLGVQDALNSFADAVQSAMAQAAKAAQAAAEAAAIKAAAENQSVLEKYGTGTQYKGYDKAEIKGAQELLDAANIAGVQTEGKTGAQIQQDLSNATGLAIGLDSNTRADQFALGGYHSGGIRMVGERGPEIEATGPSRVFSANQAKRMMQNPDLVEAVKSMKKEISELRNEQRQLGINNNKYTKRTYDLYRQWDTEGLPAERT